MRLLVMFLMLWSFQPVLAIAADSESTPAADQQLSVDINTADAIRLAEALPGIGPAKAALIVQWRTQNGPFTQIDQLLQIKGIGPKTLEKLRDYARLGAESVTSEYWPEQRRSEKQAEAAVQRIFTKLIQASDPAAIAALPRKPWYRKSAVEILSLR